MINKLIFPFVAILLLITASCVQDTGKKTLPIIGNREFVNGDTLYATVQDFNFVDQDSVEITNATFENKIYIADFFFTTCPSICPIVKRQMLRIYKRFENEPRLQIISHTLDQKYDTVPVLKDYASKMGIDAKRWHLVTGDEDLIYEMADEYFIAANKDTDAPGGFDHSGKIILVDTERHVRSFCEGTEEESVTKFMDDIDLLLSEMDQQSHDQ